MRRMRMGQFVARWVMRPTGMAQVLLGLLLWVGWVRPLVPLHMLIGMVFVLSVWAVAVLGLLGGVNRALALLTGIWGGVVLWLGMSQGRLLPGPHHWVIQVLHLAVGIAAMLLARQATRLMVMRAQAAQPLRPKLQPAS